MLKKMKTSKHRVLWIAGFLVIKIITGLAITSFSFLRLPVFAQSESVQPEVRLMPIATGFERPLAITHAGDGSERIFIVEQPGRVRVIIEDKEVTPFLDLRDRVLSPAAGGGNEQGLLGMAFPPDYAQKGHFYIYYTMFGGDNVVSRFSISPNTQLADPESEEQLLVLPHPDYTNHNGGQLAFGPDGYLYIGVGDGGGAGDPLKNSQDPGSLNGKLLRIDVEGLQLINKKYPVNNLRRFCGGYAQKYEPYRIPEDNPFVDDPAFRSEIWALGLRNPWRFSFDRLTGDLFIADVGQNRWEEINFQSAASPGGENYGWNVMEGEECYGFGFCRKTDFTLPVHVYPIFSSPDCSVTGGYVYRGEGMPGLEGVYIFGDFCSGTIWGLQMAENGWQRDILTASSLRISTFGEDEAGEIYLADIAGGGIYQIVLP